MLLLGAHMSISGGFHLAVERGHSIGCTSIQIFTKNASQWKARKITSSDKEAFFEYKEKFKINSIIAHDSYLINLASSDKKKFEKSFDAFLYEIERTEELEIPFLVMHPGAHLNSGEQKGLENIVYAFNKIGKNFTTNICIETTAGQGTNLGYNFEQIKYILDNVENNKKFGVCFDTCHVFAAGYDLREKNSYNKTISDFDRIIGIEKIKVIHLNDSLKGLGSRIDRHAHIGKGKIGLTAFELIMNDRTFSNVPKILETPKGKDMLEDINNLKILKKLIN